MVRIVLRCLLLVLPFSLASCAAVQYQRVDSGGNAEVRQMERDSLPTTKAPSVVVPLSVPAK
jgi:hypothetical protein